VILELLNDSVSGKMRPSHLGDGSGIRQALSPDDGAEGDLRDGLGWDGEVVVKGKDDFTVLRER